MWKLLLACLWLQNAHLTSAAFNSSEFSRFLADQDGARVAYLTDNKSAKKAAKQFKAARDRFYRTANAPIESACKVMKHMGKKLCYEHRLIVCQ